jgi:hypothetical protein
LSKALQQKDRTSLSKVISVFEALLCFDQWLNKLTFWTAAHPNASKLRVAEAIKSRWRCAKREFRYQRKRLGNSPNFMS